MLAGDLNLVLNVDKDSYNRKNNNYKSVSVLKAYMEEAMLIDIWWEMHKGFQFMYFKINPSKTYPRLDYIIVNHSLIAELEKVEIIPAYKTNHCAVKMCIKTSGYSTRGPGFWKTKQFYII